MDAPLISPSLTILSTNPEHSYVVIGAITFVPFILASIRSGRRALAWWRHPLHALAGMGIAYLPPDSRCYHVADGGGGVQQAALKSVFVGKDKTALIPCDISGGKAIARLGEERTFIEFLKAGGVVIIPIALIAFLIGLLYAV